MTLRFQLTLNRPAFTLDLDTTLPASGFTAIYGHSGAGKTTLLRWLAGLEPTAQGELYFKGQCWQKQQQFIPSHQRQIGYVFQDARLFPHLSVLGNLSYAWRRRFNENGPSIDDVCKWLLIEDIKHQAASTLSGGQQQRVAIARALLSSPQLILMDEPLGALDQKSRQHILPLLEQLPDHYQAPILYVSHSLEEVSRLAQQIMVLEHGQLVAQGSLLTLCSRLDLSLNHEEAAASIITAVVNQHDAHYGLSELLINGKQPLYLTQTTSPIGEFLRIRIPARDVSLTLDRPEHSSILNILACQVDAIEQTTASRVLIRLVVDEQYLLARLTRRSVDRLQLSVGQSVFAQIKTVALLNEPLPNNPLHGPAHA